APLAVAVAIGMAPSARAETPKDVLVIGHVAELQTPDPAQAVTISDFRILCNMYEGLPHYKDGTLDIVPGRATSWAISDDGKTYTFKIRQGVKYHDGSEVDAASIKFALDRVYDKNNPFNATTGPFPFAFELGPITGTEAPDKYTLVVHLSAPYSPMLTMLASSIGGLAGVSPAAVKEYGKEFSRHGGGTGPFKFKLWESNRQVVLEANPDYWQGAPKLKGLVFRPIVDENAPVSERPSGGTGITLQ